jgi:hypothetical protein
MEKRVWSKVRETGENIRIKIIKKKIKIKQEIQENKNK